MRSYRVFFFKQKTAYEMRISDWSSDVCSSDLVVGFAAETDSVEQYARQKLLKKNLDMIAANEVGHDKVFEKDDNALLVLWRDGRQELPNAPKEIGRASCRERVCQYV